MHHPLMTFEEIMPTVMQWSTAAESLAALGAHLTLAQSGTEAPQEVAEALRKVLDAAGLTGVDELPPPQQMMLASMAKLVRSIRRTSSSKRLAVRQAGRSPIRSSSTDGDVAR